MTKSAQVSGNWGLEGWTMERESLAEMTETDTPAAQMIVKTRLLRCGQLGTVNEVARTGSDEPKMQARRRPCDRVALASNELPFFAGSQRSGDPSATRCRPRKSRSER